MVERPLGNYAWVLVLQDTHQNDAPFIINVSYRTNPRDPYLDIAKGIKISGIENLRRFLTILGINGKTELENVFTATFVTTEYSVDEFMNMLAQRRNQLNGSKSLAVVGITLEEAREGLDEWARQTGNQWFDLVEVKRMEQVIVIWCYVLSEQFKTEGVSLNDIINANIEVRENNYSKEEIIKAAVEKLKRENAIRTSEENGRLSRTENLL